MANQVDTELTITLCFYLNLLTTLRLSPIISFPLHRWGNRVSECLGDLFQVTCILCITFPGLLWHIATHWVIYNNEHLLFWVSGVQKSEGKVSPRLCSLWRLPREGSFVASSSFGGLLASLSVPWLVAASLQCLPPSLPDLLPSVRPLLIRTPVVGLSTHSNPAWPRLSLMISVKTLFPNKVTF